MASPSARPDPAAEAAPETLSGSVERVTFHSEDSGFCVLRVKVRGRRQPVTVVGHLPTVTEGEYLDATGAWVNDRTHGVQFRATGLVATAPTSQSGIERYLASGMIRGIGPSFAKRLVEAFGADVFRVIEEEPARLRAVPGIGPTRAERIVEAWAEQRAVREIMVFLASHGVGVARAVRIYKTYGPNAVTVISDNPYRLARDIRGVGFRTADQIAGRLGIGRTEPMRLRAGVSYALQLALEAGHCGLPVEDLIANAAEILEAPETLVERALALEETAREVMVDEVEGRAVAFLAGIYGAERAIAERLMMLSAGDPPWPAIDAERAIPWVERETGLTLAASQREALSLAFRSKLLVITGGPGVGKTTLVNAILKVLGQRTDRIALCAPTGRAAKRLQESTGMEARTIHRLLEVDAVDGGFKRGVGAPLDCDLLVVDETSMVDVPLMHALLKAVPPQATMLLVGDVDQLPSVGPGRVLADVIESGVVPVVRLTEVFRQAAESRIITSAHAINRGEMPDLEPQEASDFYFVEARSPEDGIGKIVALVTQRIPKRFGLDPIRDIQVLSPMNRGGLGARSLNLELQGTLNPPGEGAIQRFDWTFGPGDKVMQVVNDYERDVYNGDLGVVARIDREEGELVVDFEGREVAYTYGELDELVLAYATSIHKSQGSEYPAVVIALSPQHQTMLRRNLVYTAVTRGKRLVVVVGTRGALATAVGSGEEGQRWTRLRVFLKEMARIAP